MFPENLRKLRRDRYLSQTELGDAVGVSQLTISAWERGRNRPDIDMIRTLAKFFGVTVDDLIGQKKEEVIQPTQSDLKTIEAKLISQGIDKMPEANRKRALEMMRIMFTDYADEFTRGE